MRTVILTTLAVILTSCGASTEVSAPTDTIPATPTKYNVTLKWNYSLGPIPHRASQQWGSCTATVSDVPISQTVYDAFKAAGCKAMLDTDGIQLIVDCTGQCTVGFNFCHNKPADCLSPVWCPSIPYVNNDTCSVYPTP